MCSAQTHPSLVALRSGKSTSVGLSGSHWGLGVVSAECFTLQSYLAFFFLNHIKSTPPLPLLSSGMETGHDYNSRAARSTPVTCDFAAFRFEGAPPQSHHLGLGFGSKRPFPSGDCKHLTRQNLPSDLHWWPGVGLAWAATDP